MTRAKDIATLLSTANGKIAGENLDVSFENITDTGTEGTKVASGTTAQRGTTAGQFRYNSDLGIAEYYDGTNYNAIETPPTVSSVDVSEIQSDSGLTTDINISGANFKTGSTVKFIGNDATEITPNTVTFNSSTSITVNVTDSDFLNSKEPYDVKVILPSQQSAQLDNQINVDSNPVFDTASGSIGTINDQARTNYTLLPVTVTDADGDTITYAVQSGSLPTGISLNTSTGALTGTPDAVVSDTTSNFTIRATANSKTVDRAFSITVLAPVATGGDTVDSYDDGGTTYVYHQFNSNGTFSLLTAKTVDYLLVGGGAGGGNSSAGGGDGAGGGGAGGYIYLTSQSLTAGSYSAVIGNGGSAQSGGANTTFNGYTAGGGGAGGFDETAGSGGSATNGSGGGAGCRSTSGGTGNGTGGNGGNGGSDSGGGGGGSSSNGQNAPAGSTAGNGGSGTSNSITGTAVIYAVGGGGGVQGGTGAGNGSADGGGKGAYLDGSTQVNATAGTANRGNGGGGGGVGYLSGSATSGASGGSGVVIIRYAV